MKRWVQGLCLGACSFLLAGCESENELTVERTVDTPQQVEFRDLEVVVYSKHTEVRQDPRCGTTWVGNNPIYNTCPVDVYEEERREKISLNVLFPEGAELSGRQKEKFVGTFTNDYDHPELPYGFLSIRAHSKYHQYDEEALQNIQVPYGVITDIAISLKE